MRVFTYSEARQKLAHLLDIALNEEVLIKRRGGDTFTLARRTSPESPLDVPGVSTKARTRDILEAVRDSREGRSPRGNRSK